MMENCPLLLTTDSAVSQSDSASLSHAKNCVLNFEERKNKRIKCFSSFISTMVKCGKSLKYDENVA
jgi:hypothetical protein